MDSDATNHLRYRLEWRKLSSGDGLIPLENEFNGMAQLGWQLHSICYLPGGSLLIVYSGLIDNEPMQDNEIKKYWETERGF